MSNHVLERTVHYYAVDRANRRVLSVPNITSELAERWAAEGYEIVTMLQQRHRQVFGEIKSLGEYHLTVQQEPT